MGRTEGKTLLGEAISKEIQEWVGFKATAYTLPELGMNPEQGFDCSGLARFVLTRVHNRVKLPFPPSIRGTNEFLDSFGALVGKKRIRPGDLLIFADEGLSYPKHMGIATSSREFVEARPEEIGKVIKSEIVIREYPDDEIPERAQFDSNLIAVKRDALRVGTAGTINGIDIGRTWQLTDVYIEDIAELTEVIDPTKIDINDLPQLDWLINRLSDDNNLIANFKMFHNLTRKRLTQLALRQSKVATQTGWHEV